MGSRSVSDSKVSCASLHCSSWVAGGEPDDAGSRSMLSVDRPAGCRVADIVRRMSRTSTRGSGGEVAGFEDRHDETDTRRAGREGGGGEMEGKKGSGGDGEGAGRKSCRRCRVHLLSRRSLTHQALRVGETIPVIRHFQSIRPVHSSVLTPLLFPASVLV